MNNNEDIDIYELVNDLSFDLDDIVEIELDEISKKRVNKKIKKRIKKNFNKNNKVIASTIVAASLFLAFISPLGQEVIAGIKEKFFFAPGVGITNDANAKVLIVPVNFKNEEGNFLIKGAISSNRNLDLELWILEQFRELDIKNDVKIKLPNNEVREIDNYGIGGDSIRKCLKASFNNIDNNIAFFELLINDKSIGKIYLDNIKENKDIDNNKIVIDDKTLISAVTYKVKDKTYIEFIGGEDFNLNNIRYTELNKENIKITDSKGKKIKFDYSDISGNGKEFVINDNYEGDLLVEIDKLDINYTLKSNKKIKINIPKKGEKVEINKVISIDELDEKILLKSIAREDNKLEIKFDIDKYSKENSMLVIMRGTGSIYYGSIGASEEDKSIIINIDTKDINLIDKLAGTFNFEINGIQLRKYGNWRLKL